MSYEWEEQEIVRLADYVVTGEGDLAFAELCRAILSGHPPPEKVVAAEPPDLNSVRLPYDLYGEDDIAHRVVYVESSRGCPFECEFCLSSLEIPVRRFPLEPFLAALGDLADRGVTHFKFVDRTFNVHIPTARAILEFLLARWRPGSLYHFEMIPDRLPDELKELIRRFPPGALQFEIGIQTFNRDVGGRIRRKQDEVLTEENLRFLREETGVHIHADLIVGLPGEDLESFASGLDRLVGLNPQEIQVGILKRLRGTTLGRHDAEWGMIYRADPPYDLLANNQLGFNDMQRMKRFARYWNLVVNNGRFVETAPGIWAGEKSVFRAFSAFSDWLFEQEGRHYGIALSRLTDLLTGFLIEMRGRTPESVRESLARDLSRSGKRQDRHRNPTR